MRADVRGLASDAQRRNGFDMSKDDRDRKVRAVLEAAEGPLGPTEIARRIDESWCGGPSSGYPRSSAIVPVLRRIGAVKAEGAYLMRPNKVGPTLVSTSVTVRYRADDGYSAETMFKSNKPASMTPEAVLIDALEELARLTALFGLEDKALEAFDKARQRVFDWRKDCGA